MVQPRFWEWEQCAGNAGSHAALWIIKMFDVMVYAIATQNIKLFIVLFEIKRNTLVL